MEEVKSPDFPIKNILSKLHAIQGDIEKMEKDGHNNHSNYNYLSETQLTMKMKELLDKHKVMFVYSSYIKDKQTTPSGKQIMVDVQIDYRFYDVETGEFIGGSACGQGADVGDKGTFKAITGAIKYIYMKTFNIPTGDDPEKTTKEEYVPVDEPPFGDGGAQKETEIADSIPKCPKCGGMMKVNDKKKSGTKAPDFKCLDPNCKTNGFVTGAWLPKK